MSDMYDNFDDCLRALLEDDGLDAAHGGVIWKEGTRFDYSLHPDETPDEATEYLGLYPSSNPSRNKWTVVHHGGQPAETDYHAFISDPNNGELIPG